MRPRELGILEPQSLARHLGNQHSDFEGLTHEELSVYTHQQLRDEVISHG